MINYYYVKKEYVLNKQDVLNEQGGKICQNQ